MECLGKKKLVYKNLIWESVKKEITFELDSSNSIIDISCILYLNFGSPSILVKNVLIPKFGIKMNIKF